MSAYPKWLAKGVIVKDEVEEERYLSGKSHPAVKRVPTAPRQPTTEELQKATGRIAELEAINLEYYTEIGSLKAQVEILQRKVEELTPPLTAQEKFEIKAAQMRERQANG